MTAQREAELAAWSAYMSAVARVDVEECVRLWAIFRELHAQRPAELVRQMEVERGLA